MKYPAKAAYMSADSRWSDKCHSEGNGSDLLSLCEPGPWSQNANKSAKQTMRLNIKAVNSHVEVSEAKERDFARTSASLGCTVRWHVQPA